MAVVVVVVVVAVVAVVAVVNMVRGDGRVQQQKRIVKGRRNRKLGKMKS
jgi:hypothetical protein